MATRRALICFLSVAALASAAVLSRESESVGAQLSAKAETFVAGLNAEQQAKALFAFDDQERTNWHFVPLQEKKKPLRKGLRLIEMNAEQQSAALALLKAGTSSQGFEKASTIMSLESILRELETTNGANERNPGWYFFSIFGTPSKSGKWGWRVEGHHLSLNFTLDRGEVVAATPFFLGANPAIVKDGPRKGLRTLPEAEVRAGELIDSLTDEQRSLARQEKQFPEIAESTARAKVGEPVGIAAAKLDAKQRDILKALLLGYADRMPAIVAQREMKRLEEAGFDKIHFAYAREEQKPGKPYTYRVQGPTFVIEFLNVQADSANNPANHIHSAWRDLPGDFGALR